MSIPTVQTAPFWWIVPRALFSAQYQQSQEAQPHTAVHSRDDELPPVSQTGPAALISPLQSDITMVCVVRGEPKFKLEYEVEVSGAGDERWSWRRRTELAVALLAEQMQRCRSVRVCQTNQMAGGGAERRQKVKTMSPPVQRAHTAYKHKYFHSNMRWTYIFAPVCYQRLWLGELTWNDYKRNSAKKGEEGFRGVDCLPLPAGRCWCCSECFHCK